MKCPNCLSEVENGQEYCKSCGRKLTQSDNSDSRYYNENKHRESSRKNNETTIPSQYKPIGAWGYVGYQILFSIPVIGIILLIVFSLSDENINRRNFARSYFCVVLLVILLLVIFGTTIYGFLEEILKSLQV